MSRPVIARLQLTFAGLFLLLGTSCSQPYLGVKLPFVATWGGAPIQCEDVDIALSDLRFYVSAISMLDERGNWVGLELHDDLPWQQTDLGLVDLENAQGACNNGTNDVYGYLVGSVPPGAYKGLRFTIGVPFERNHANPMTAKPPLDQPAMHWHWRSGYKFLRAGITTADDGFWIHVGSAGCEGTVRAVSGCRSPNRVNVELGEFVPGSDSVAVDLKALFDSVDLSDGQPGNCSSGPAEIDCTGPFEALGLTFGSGAPAGQQRVFSLQR